jgi:hypothetical protein
MKRLLPTGLLVLGLLGLRGPEYTYAQTASPVYSVVDQSPQLPSGGGNEALAAALERNFVYPPDASPRDVYGALHYSVVVLRTGQLAALKLDDFSNGFLPKSLNEATQEAFRRLPQLVPGRRAGQPVNVLLHVDWTFSKETVANRYQLRITIGDQTRDEPDLSDLSGEVARPVQQSEAERNLVYTYVEQMPSLPGGGGLPAINAAVQRLLVSPANATQGRVFVSLIVEKQGRVSTPTILKGLSTSADAAVLAAVKRLPLLQAGKQNGRPVRVQLTLIVTLPSPAKQPATRPQPKR